MGRADKGEGTGREGEGGGMGWGREGERGGEEGVGLVAMLVTWLVALLVAMFVLVFLLSFLFWSLSPLRPMLLNASDSYRTPIVHRPGCVTRTYPVHRRIYIKRKHNTP